MTRDEFLFHLRSLEIRLLSPEVNAWLAKQNDATKQKFVNLTFDLRLAIMKLTSAQLSDIASRLESLEGDIKKGIDGLQKSIDNLKKTVDLINTLSTVVGYAARVVGLVL